MENNFNHVHDDVSRKELYPDSQKGIGDYSIIFRNKKVTKFRKKGTLELQKGKRTASYPCPNENTLSFFIPNNFFMTF